MSRIITSNTTLPVEPLSESEIIFAAIAAIIFSFVGTVVNLYKIVTLSRCQTRFQATTKMIISLSTSDFLFCIVNLPILGASFIYYNDGSVFQEWLQETVLCHWVPFFFYGNCATSMVNLVAISITRYILICHSYDKYIHIYYKSKFNISRIIKFIWVFSYGLLILPYFEVWGKFGKAIERPWCTILPKNGHSPKVFYIILAFVVPCVVIITCYTAIFIKVRRDYKQNDLQLLKMMLIIFSVFFIGFLPSVIVNAIDRFVQRPSIHIIPNALFWAIPTINPFIHGALDKILGQTLLNFGGVYKPRGQTRGEGGFSDDHNT